MRRREFVVMLGAGVAVATARELMAQQTPAMDAGAHRPVRLPAKGAAVAMLSDDEIRQLELGLACQCSCRRDVYNCRTTDFACQVSPAMHRDVLALVEGGYNADEIVSAFVDVYGEKARMAPKAEGFFNRMAYLTPYIATGGAAVLVGAWIMKHLRGHEDAAPAAVVPARPVDATSEELERIQRALRESGT
jgi:cytochrome c-type biogenesis protein CcmH